MSIWPVDAHVECQQVVAEVLQPAEDTDLIISQIPMRGRRALVHVVPPFPRRQDALFIDRQDLIPAALVKDLPDLQREARYAICAAQALFHCGYRRGHCHCSRDLRIHSAICDHCIHLRRGGAC